MHDDIFEEDMFEEESARSPSNDELDEETRHVLELMKKGVSLAEQVTEYFDKIIEVNELFDESITGVPTMALKQMRAVYADMLPNLIVGEKEQLVISTQKALNTTEKVAQEFIDEKQATLLENIDKSNKK